MDLHEVLRMAAGDALASYAANSNLQGNAIAKARPEVLQSVEELCSAILLPGAQHLVVADLGCSYGPNAFAVISEVMDAVGESCRKLRRRLHPEVQFFMNDLPANDFNSLFRYLASFKRQVEEEKGEELARRLYVAGVPGTFYGRLFPSRSVHLFHSSSTVHWLSQVPEGLKDEKGDQVNKGNIYVGKTSPPRVHELYLRQFQRDFSTFLRCRSEEIQDGALMVLTIIVTTSADHPRSGTTILICQLMTEVLKSMADEGIIKEADVDAFNVPFYSPSPGEVRAVIDDQGAFEIARESFVDSYWDGFDDRNNDHAAGGKLPTISSRTRGQSAVGTMRAAMEPMFACLLGDGNVADVMFARLAGVVTREFEKGEQFKCPFYVVTLKRNTTPL